MEKWDTIISSKKSLFDLKIKDIIKYWDLCVLFVRRDFVAQYKQTILGPIWFFIQPLFTAYTYYLVLVQMGGLETDGLPPFLFYISGLTIWGYFRDSFTKTANTFTTNAGIFGKVYFPRVITPLSIVISQLLKLGIQSILLIITIVYFHFSSDAYFFELKAELLLLPIIIIMMAGLSLGAGMIISSMTTKYKDLQQLLQFGVQLLMYFSAVIISTNQVGEMSQNIGGLIKYNPLSQIIESFKVCVLGVGEISWYGFAYAGAFSFGVLIFGVAIFNRTEKNFIDTV